MLSLFYLENCIAQFLRVFLLFFFAVHYVWEGSAGNESQGIVVKCCPDTGATQTVIHERISQRANIKLNKPRIGMNSITGPMDIIWEAEIVLKYDGLFHLTFALVARGMEFTRLVAWHDLQPLQVISDSFPSRISAATSHDLTSAVVAEFPSVFKDELGEAPMNVPKISIHLTENYVPYRFSTARQVPLRFTDPAEKVVSDLINARVISPVSEPTECFFCVFFKGNWGQS